MSRALVIIPTYNEIENIEKMLNTVMALPGGYEVLIVDDGSPDGTAEVVRRLMQAHEGRIHLEERTGKLGLGTAYIHGFKWALTRNYPYVFEMDCDFSHNPEDLPRLLEACESGADVSIGSRYVQGVNVVNWPMSRVLLSYFDKEVEDRWRKMPTPQFSRHLANQVEPEVVEALRDAVVAAYPKISHRYYALKAKWLGLDTLEVWDRNAPLDSDNSSDIQWEDAKKIVLDAYADFSPKMADIAEPFFTKGWIDAGVKPGKAPGAFAHPTVTNVHPYVMLNYMGKQRDVMTLAHELGHGVHQVLAASQGELLSSTPLTLAETASVFGEMLTFRKMLENTTDPVKRKHLLANKVEDMINTVVRQIAFYDFECKLHAARVNGELTPDQINEIWMSIQGESLGPVFNFVEGYETFWTYIPHFIHSPFYVYAYAFGDGLVNALYAVYEEGDTDFQDKYFDMLSAGGSMHHKELLAPFGLDASDPKFWDKGLSLISSMIDELETMEN